MWMRAEVVETAEDSTVSGTIVGIRFVLLLRIALRLVASSNVPGDSALHPALPQRGVRKDKRRAFTHTIAHVWRVP